MKIIVPMLVSTGLLVLILIVLAVVAAIQQPKKERKRRISIRDDIKKIKKNIVEDEE